MPEPTLQRAAQGIKLFTMGFCGRRKELLFSILLKKPSDFHLWNVVILQTLMSSQNAFVSSAADSFMGEEESGRSILPHSWGWGGWGGDPSTDAREWVFISALSWLWLDRIFFSCPGFVQAAVDMVTRNCMGFALAN